MSKILQKKTFFFTNLYQNFLSKFGFLTTQRKCNFLCFPCWIDFIIAPWLSPGGTNSRSPSSVTDAKLFCNSGCFNFFPFSHRNWRVLDNLSTVLYVIIIHTKFNSHMHVSTFFFHAIVLRSFSMRNLGKK